MNTQKIIGSYIFSQQAIIGKGAFGTVYLGQNQETSEYVAIKTIEKNMISHQSINQSLNEIQSMNSLKNDNIVRLIEVLETVNNIYLVSEYCEGGDLRELIKNGPVSEKELVNILGQILNAFQELQRQKITHRDLKPANILIKQSVFKLADFGFARQLENLSDDIMRSVAGTPLYMAPQVLMNQPYSSKCDIWSIGMIAHELLYQRPPFPAQNLVELINQINIPIRLPKNLSFELADFIQSCLQFKESDRIGWDTIHNHDIFKQYPLIHDNQTKKINQQKLQIDLDMDLQIGDNFNLSNTPKHNYNTYQTQLMQTYLDQEFNNNALVIDKHLGFIKFLFNFCIFLEKHIKIFQMIQQISKFLEKLKQFTIRKLMNLESLFSGNNWLQLKEMKAFHQSILGMQIQENITSFRIIVNQRFLYLPQEINEEHKDAQSSQSQFFQILYDQKQVLLEIINEPVTNKHLYLVLLLMISQIPWAVNDCTFPILDVQHIIHYPDIELIKRINQLQSQ